MPRWSPQGLQAPVGALHTEPWPVPRVLSIQSQLMYTTSRATTQRRSVQQLAACCMYRSGVRGSRVLTKSSLETLLGQSAGKAAAALASRLSLASL